MEKVTTLEDVEYEIKKAVKVLRALPKDGPCKAKSCWPKFPPEYENDAFQKFSANFVPMPCEVDDMDEVFENWFKVLDRDDKLLVFYKNLGYSAKLLMRIFKKSRSTVYAQYKKALQNILDYLQEQNMKNCA